jgi:UDP-3-O-[3-hydroxymyristoyl] glucosamine N-acyltransferase
VEAGRIIAGFNAMPIRDWLKVQVILPKLSDLNKSIKRLEKQLQEMKEQISETSKGESP